MEHLPVNRNALFKDDERLLYNILATLERIETKLEATPAAQAQPTTANPEPVSAAKPKQAKKPTQKKE